MNFKKKQNIVEAGSVHKKFEINDQYLDEIFENNNP